MYSSAGQNKQALLAVVPQTAFKDAAELSEHLAEHIVAKGTSQDISAEIAKRGGPDTYNAMNVNAQRMSAENPDRQEWEREWTVIICARCRDPQPCRGVSCQDGRRRSEGEEALRHEQRKAEAAIVDAAR